MRFIFLDIEGVVTSVQVGAHGVLPLKMGVPDDRCMGLDPALVQRLNRVVAVTGAVVVVSSSWRNSHGLAETEATLRRAGFQGTILGCTPDLGDNRLRAKEIQAFLDGRGNDVTSFVVLDDSDNMGHLMNRLILTHPMNGMSEKDAAMAIAMLTAGDSTS